MIFQQNSTFTKIHPTKTVSEKHNALCILGYNLKIIFIQKSFQKVDWLYI